MQPQMHIQGAVACLGGYSFTSPLSQLSLDTHSRSSWLRSPSKLLLPRNSLAVDVSLVPSRVLRSEAAGTAWVVSVICREMCLWCALRFVCGVSRDACHEMHLWCAVRYGGGRRWGYAHGSRETWNHENARRKAAAQGPPT